MHLHDSLCFDTGYGIMSWPGGFTGLVGFCEVAEPFHPKRAWLSEEKCGCYSWRCALWAQFTHLSCVCLQACGQSCVAWAFIPLLLTRWSHILRKAHFLFNCENDAWVLWKRGSLN